MGWVIKGGFLDQQLRGIQKDPNIDGPHHFDIQEFNVYISSFLLDHPGSIATRT
jgi:hypothetical protein